MNEIDQYNDYDPVRECLSKKLDSWPVQPLIFVIHSLLQCFSCLSYVKPVTIFIIISGTFQHEKYAMNVLCFILNSFHDIFPPMECCRTVCFFSFSGFVFQYSFLAMFFWLNVMCFDIWRVIRYDDDQGHC